MTTILKQRLVITMVVLAVAVATGYFYRQHAQEQREKQLCARALVTALIDAAEAEVLADDYFQHPMKKRQNIYLIRRKIEEITNSLETRLPSGEQLAARIPGWMVAVRDWKQSFQAGIDALEAIEQRGEAIRTGEIEAYARLQSEGFLKGLREAFGTFTNLPPEGQLKTSVTFGISVAERQNLINRLAEHYNRLRDKVSRREGISGSEWALVATANFLHSGTVDPSELLKFKDLAKE